MQNARHDHAADRPNGILCALLLAENAPRCPQSHSVLCTEMRDKACWSPLSHKVSWILHDCSSRVRSCVLVTRKHILDHIGRKRRNEKRKLKRMSENKSAWKFSCFFSPDRTSKAEKMEEVLRFEASWANNAEVQKSKICRNYQQQVVTKSAEHNAESSD